MDNHPGLGSVPGFGSRQPHHHIPSLSARSRNGARDILHHQERPTAGASPSEATASGPGARTAAATRPLPTGRRATSSPPSSAPPAAHSAPHQVKLRLPAPRRRREAPRRAAGRAVLQPEGPPAVRPTRTTPRCPRNARRGIRPMIHALTVMPGHYGVSTP